MSTINLEKTMPEEFYHEPKSGRKHLTKAIFLSAAFIVVFVAGAFGGIWYYQRQITTNNLPPSDTVVVSSTPAIDQAATVASSSVDWKSLATLLPNLKLVLSYKDDNATSETSDDYIRDYGESDVSYYDMGMRGANKVILASVIPEGPAFNDILFFEQDPSGAYHHLSKSFPVKLYDSSAVGETLRSGYDFSSLVLSTDNSTMYSGLTAPDKFSYQGLTFTNPNIGAGLRFLGTDFEQVGAEIGKIGTVAEGDVYVKRPEVNFQESVGDPKLESRQYILKLASGFYVVYSVVWDFFADDSVPAITWMDGTKNQDPYRRDGGLAGCGGGVDYVTLNSSVADNSHIADELKQTGVTDKGEMIYEFKDLNNKVVKYFYNLANYSEEKISLEKWYTHHNLIVYKNSLGDYVIFSNDKYGLQAECGKPVVYLYPTKTTKVKVQVGADITKSEPNYDKGWQVTAEPSGKLTNADGLTYDSLFWEGLGHGAYPAITEGTIVSQSNLQTTIKAQLTELGLSAKESADFLDFWSDKLPKTPYVRLTWFTTKQMDELAPLFVSPRPDSVIRIFLDFQGYQTKISLPAQKLSAIPRTGFTVIEWGGLLRK